MALPQAVLRRATVADAAAALSWTPDLADLRRWAGPSMNWPDTVDAFWAELDTTDSSTFALESPSRGVVGFGQIKLRIPAFGHLARIIVNPRHRGCGFGRTLCIALMREAPRLHAIKGYSLYVYRDNSNAIALYKSLGFVERIGHPKFDEIVLMEAPLPPA